MPAKQKLHHPLDPKRAKHKAPQSSSHRTIQEEMVHRLPITATHTTPSGHRIAPPHQIVTGPDLVPGCWPNKEAHPRRSLTTPNATAREWLPRRSPKNIIEGPNIKQPNPLKSRPHSILTISFRNIRVKKSHKRDNPIQFPIIKISNESHIPINHLIVKKNSSNGTSLLDAHPKRTGKASFKGISPHHLSCHNLILFPVPTLNPKYCAKVTQPIIILFHTPQPTYFSRTLAHLTIQNSNALKNKLF